MISDQRGWSVAVVATSAVLASLLVGSEPLQWQLYLGLAAISTYLGFWFAFGNRVAEHSRAAIPFAAITILFAAAVTFAHPVLAVVQCIAFPLLWTRLDGIRPAIIANLAMVLAVGTGIFVADGATVDSLIEAAIIEGLSLTFSIFLGLWITRIATQSHQRQQLLDELQAAQSELSLLSRDAGVTSERERLAREIHDTIAQDLTGLVMLAQRAGRDLSTGDTAAAGEQLALLEEGARTALAETRALVASTSPPGLDDGGIAAALTRLGQRFTRETGTLVEVSADVRMLIERDIEVVLLRCAQEGLANVRKHSGASAASIALVARSTRFSLEVRDNGAGFELGQRTEGYGLTGMRERLGLVDGTLDIESGDSGTTLLITLPTKAAP